MTTNDIDAIRQLTDAATPGPWEHGGNDGLVWPERVGDPVSGSTETADAEFIAAARTHVPALCDEIEQLRAELDKARQDRDEYAEDNTRVAVALVDVQRKLTAEIHRADGLAAGVRSLEKAQTAYANENDRLRSHLAHADEVIASLRAAIDEDGEAEQRCPNCAPGYDCESGTYTPEATR